MHAKNEKQDKLNTVSPFKGLQGTLMLSLQRRENCIHLSQFLIF